MLTIYKFAFWCMKEMFKNCFGALDGMQITFSYFQEACWDIELRIGFQIKKIQISANQCYGPITLKLVGSRYYFEKHFNQAGCQNEANENQG